MKLRLTPRAAGFSLIELLVSMVIALVVTLAITSVLIRSEGSKRSTTSVNDIDQTGAYTAYLLDRAIRSAGSGFSQSWNTVYGCLLDVSQGSTHVLPTTIPTSSAFARVTDTTSRIRLAPVIIGKDLANTTGTGAQVRGDVLMVMGGTAGFGESPRNVQVGSVTSTNLRLTNTLGFKTNDLVLLADTGVTGGCMMQQVTFPGTTQGGTSQDLPLAGTYYGASGTNVNLTDFGASTIALQMGNAVGNMPQMQLFGVGDNNTLLSYDLLQPVTAGTVNDVQIADGVVELRALYGVDTDLDGKVDTWVHPPGSTYGASYLTNGSTTSQATLRTIIAIRVGLILRTSLAERPQDYQQPAGTTLTLFSDSVAPQTRTLSASELNYRFRTVEVTIPLRNVMLAP